MTGWLVVLLLILLLCGPVLAPYNPLKQNRDSVNLGPSLGHWMGTDDYGRDILSRFLAGGSWSILTGLLATILVLALGWIFGGLAGYRGGWTDQIMMRFTELLLSLPWLYLLIGLRALLPLSLKPREAVALLLLITALVSWARPARLVRGMVLSLSQRGYIQSARGFRVPEWKIFLRHILPDTTGLLLTQARLLLPRFILAEVTLTFLGLGTGEPEPSWGALILPLRQAYLLRDQWWRLVPAVLMLLLFLTLSAASGVAVKRHTDAR